MLEDGRDGMVAVGADQGRSLAVEGIMTHHHHIQNLHRAPHSSSNGDLVSGPD